MFKTIIKRLIIFCIIISMILLASCAPARRPGPGRPEGMDGPQIRQQSEKKPALPKPIKAQEGKEPKLKVFITDEKKVEELPFEEYVAGVVGGEIKNDWPIEAIKAQAIIARTFVLRFIADKGHSGLNKEAHVSTSIEEAQAWNPDAVNENIKKAVKETRGQVIVHDGKFALTWFHSNAAGKTATAKEGLNYKKANPPYIQVVDSPDDSPEIPKDEEKWTVSFPKSKVVEALGKAGGAKKSFSRVSIGKKGPSGRALTILFDGKAVSAPELRVALGSTELKSTMLDEVTLDGDKVTFKGRGYGHGVGMSQWGAYSLAKKGKKAEDIINHYFKGTRIVSMWK